MRTYPELRLRSNDVGRTLLKINDKYHFTTYNKTRKFIKFCKTLRHPLDRNRRRRIARRLQKTSPYANLISERHGYSILKSGFIPGSEKIIAECRKLYNRNLPDMEKLVGHKVFVYLLLANEAGAYDVNLNSDDVYDLSLIPGLSEFVLSPMMIEAATCYLGEVPILAGVTIYASLPNGTKEGGQLYHLDKGDFRQAKFIFGVTDMHEDNGPFTFIPADKAREVEAAIGEDFYKRVPDERVYDAVGEDAAIQFIGPQGSCLIVDTGRCLHYGSRNNKEFRCLLEIQYLSSFSVVEPSFHYSRVKTEAMSNKLDKFQKLILASMRRA